jgi:hypothetical protein
VIRAYKSDAGYTLISDDGVVIPLTANEAHSVYMLVAAELDRVRRTLEEPEAHDA